MYVVKWTSEVSSLTGQAHQYHSEKHWLVGTMNWLHHSHRESGVSRDAGGQLDWGVLRESLYNDVILIQSWFLY